MATTIQLTTYNNSPPSVGVHSAHHPKLFRRFTSRHPLFIVGCLLALVSTIVFLIGFSAPAWKDMIGLWLNCENRDACKNIVGVGPDWLEAVRAMECLALIFFALAIFVEVYQDFSSPPPPENKAVEALAGLAGMFGIIGIIVFGAKSPNRDENVYDPVTRNVTGTYKSYLQWGFGLTAGGSSGIVVCAIIIGIGRLLRRSHTEAAMAAAGYAPHKHFVRFVHRHVFFQVGWIFMLVAAIIFTIGFSAPAWKDRMGLWMNCTSDNCVSNVNNMGPDWFDAVRAMECLALICFIFAIAVEIRQDFVVPPTMENVAVEAFTGFAGMFGIIGIIIFGAKSPNVTAPILDASGMNIASTTSYLQWGFGLTAGGSSLAVVCALLMAWFRCSHKEHTDAAVVSAGYPVHAPCSNVAGMYMTGPVMPASQVPVYYVMHQGVLVPVYTAVPVSKTTTTTVITKTKGDARSSDHFEPADGCRL